MNRRDFLTAGFKLGAAGLLLPFIEPARKVWALDRTMVLSDHPVIDDYNYFITSSEFAGGTSDEYMRIYHEISRRLEDVFLYGDDYAARSFSSSI